MQELDRLRYAIERIKAIAEDRPLLIVTIPEPRDFSRAAARAGAPPLVRDLQMLSVKLGIAYIDLMEKMELAANSILACDGHWSAAGHRRAADAIVQWNFYRR